MNIPCSTTPARCAPGTDGDDALIPNASAETPDVRMFFGYRFQLRSSNFCEATTQLAADLCALNPPDPFQDEVIYSSNEQTCTIDCFGSPVSYTVPSGAALGLTQAAADASAYALACVGASIVCGGGSGTLFPNEAQACSVTCQDGTVVTGTIPAGALQGFSQAEANAAAYTIACQAAAAQCPDIPPPNFGNVALAGTSNCPDGGVFTFLVAANTFFASTLAEANATAQSYADQQAVLQRSCLSNIDTTTCASADIFYDETITTDLPGPVSWSVTGGALPDGLLFDEGRVYGSPETSGSFTFTVQAISSNGNYIVRDYTVVVFKITTTDIPDSIIGIPYSFAMTQTGATSPTWSATGLPKGLSIDASTGVISGTPALVGNYPFASITITVGSHSCSKLFNTNTDEVEPFDWWKLDEAASNPRVGSLNGILLGPGGSGSVSSVPGGKYGNATALNSTGTPTFSTAFIYNTGAAVTDMAYEGNGVDAFVWLDIPNVSNSDTILYVAFHNNAGVEVWHMSMTIDNLVGISWEMTGGTTSGIQALGTSANYRLFEFYYDPDLGRLGVRVNNGAVFDQWVAAPTSMLNTVKGGLSVTYARRTAGTASADVCELAVYPLILNSTQRAYIYNAGAGQTWPVTLP